MESKDPPRKISPFGMFGRIFFGVKHPSGNKHRFNPKPKVAFTLELDPSVFTELTAEQCWKEWISKLCTGPMNLTENDKTIALNLCSTAWSERAEARLVSFEISIDGSPDMSIWKFQTNYKY